MIKKFFYISVIAVIVFLCSTAGSALAAGQAFTEGIKVFLKHLPDTDYVAMVGQEKITVPEYKFFLSNIKASIKQALALNPEDEKTFWAGRIGNTTAEGYAKGKALEKGQEFKIQLMKAKESGIKLGESDKEASTAYFNNIISSYNGETAAEETIKGAYGISLDELKSIYEESQMINKFVSVEKEKIQPAQSQLKDYYDSYMEVPGKKTTVQHILISTRDSEGNSLSDEEIAKKKSLAEDILSRVNSGTDFNSLVQQYSDDPGSKSTGGEYTFEKGEMVKEFEDWAFAAKPGDTGMIQSMYGLHIMKKPTFEEELNVIKQKYLDDAYTNMLSQWKPDKKYTIVKNRAVYDKISVL